MATADRSEAGLRAERWLRAWDSQGLHRTGTAGDRAGAEWLVREAEQLGVRVELERFSLERIDPIDAALLLGSDRIDAVSAFDGPSTDAGGVTGKLGPLHTNATIGVVELSPRAVYSGEYQEIRRSAAHQGIVIICKGDNPGLGLLNAEQFRQPFGTPAIHVSSDVRDQVLQAAADGAMATLLAHSRRAPAVAINVIVTLPGVDPSRSKLVIMTPRSSWWQSTSERGGGIVCWLESLRLMANTQLNRDVVFTANSGHELGHIGLDDFMARRPGWEKPEAGGGAVWIHYGANIGARGGELSIQSNDDALRLALESELRKAGCPPDAIAPKTLVPSGESRDIHRAGGRYVTLVGTNPLFHLPADRWPHAVESGAVARIAAAAAQFALPVAS